MTAIRSKLAAMLAPKPAPRPDLKAAVKQGIAQVKDGFQAAKPKPMIDPAMIETRTRCFPEGGAVFNEGSDGVGEKIKDALTQRPPLDPAVIEEGIYRLGLTNMTPKELFAEEAKQRDILEDATTGPIQDKDAAAQAEKRLAAIEAERARRAEEPQPGPLFPNNPIELPIFRPGYKVG